MVALDGNSSNYNSCMKKHEYNSIGLTHSIACHTICTTSNGNLLNSYQDMFYLFKEISNSEYSANLCIFNSQ